MIRIENMNITFDRPLIQDGIIEIYPGQLTLVQGESGSGKSSLLSVIGLLTDHHQEHYQFNEVILDQSEAVRAAFRKHHIGYVFQDKSLFDHLSIYENMTLYTEISGKTLTKQKAKSVLAQVHLDKNLDQSIDTLSGGEKQRLAIACALCKEPELLILDEPTSALDLKNVQMIVDVLRELASQGKMIMIASHDAMLIEACDAVYVIEKGRLEKVRTQPSIFIVSKRPQRAGKIPFKFYLSYYLSFFRKNIGHQLIMLLICGLCVAFMIAERNVSKGYENKQLSHIDTMLGKEIFVTALADGKGNAVYDQSLPTIHEVTLKRLQNLAHFQEMYPYYEINVTMIDSDQVRCVIQPYTRNKPIESYLFDGQFTENGVYVTYGLDKQLNVLDRSIDIEGILPDGSSCVFEDLYVDGVFDKDYHNNYSYGENIIFVPMEMMPIQENVQALLVYSDHYDATNELKEAICQQDSNLGVLTSFSRTIEGNHAMENIKHFIHILTMIITALSIVLMGLVYSGYITNRKFEISLLRANGLDRKEVVKLIFAEMIVQTIMMSCISLILISVGYQYFQHNLSIVIQNRWILDIFRSFFYAFLLIFFPSVISLLIYQRLDMASALRTD